MVGEATADTSRRLSFLRVLAGLALLAALAAGLVAQGAGDPTTAHAKKKKKQPKPNVVVILTDDMDASQMRIMDEVNSEIGDNGVTFANSFVNWAVCCPSRATLLTGQYAQNHNVRGNSANTGGGFANFNNNNTLALWLQAAGYSTTHIGKFLNGYGGAGSGASFVPPGWTEWYAGTDGTTQTVFNYTLNENGNLIDYGDDVSDFKQDVFTDKAVDLIDRRAPQKKPFFLHLSYTASHGGGPNPNPNPPTNECAGTAKPAPRHADVFDNEPLPMPPNFNEADRSDKPEGIRTNPPLSAGDIADITRNYRCRLGSLLSVDEGVGEIMDALRAAGELKNTLVIFTSDNGFFHGEHTVKAGKTRLYEPSIRVPYVMRGPGVPKAGKTVRDLIINADTATTIVDAANANARLPMDGRSLFRTARRPGKVSGRTMMLDTTGYKAVRTQRFIYAEHDTGEIEMYDLEADPFELESVHDDAAYNKERSRLAQLLAEFRRCSGRECARGPRVKLKLKPDKTGQGCRPPRLKATLKGGEKRIVTEAAFRGGGKRDRDRHKPFNFNLNAAGKGKVKIKATIELRDGRVDSTLKRKTKVC
jgi:N-acetylglucosamine-6-sulfatase